MIKEKKKVKKEMINYSYVENRNYVLNTCKLE